MSTENNIDDVFKNSLKILTDLIAFKTISGEDNNSLINYCDEILKKNGASSFKTYDKEKKRANLFSSLKSKKTSNKKPIIFSGHTDVVPVSKGWSSDPFTATIKGDKLYGRGSCDMKGFSACTVAYAPIYSKSKLDRDIHFSFTCDEETACQGAPILIKELKKRDAERKVLKAFKKIEIPFKSFLFHSVNITEHQYKIWGEIDFLLISKNGIMVFEVKGGRVSRKNGIWI